MVDEWLGRRRVSLHSHYYGADHLTFEVRGQVISDRKNLAKNLERKQNSCMEFLATGNHSLYTATVNQRIIQLPGVSIYRDSSSRYALNMEKACTSSHFAQPNIWQRLQSCTVFSESYNFFSVRFSCSFYTLGMAIYSTDIYRLRDRQLLFNGIYEKVPPANSLL